MADTVTVRRATELIGVNRSRVHQLIEAGRIRVIAHEATAGRGRLLLNKSDVEREAALRKEA